MRSHHPTVSEFFVSSTDSFILQTSAGTAAFQSSSPFNISINQIELDDFNFSSKAIDLRSEKNKVIITAAPGIYHLFFEVLPVVVTAACKYDADVIFDIKILKTLQDEKYFHDVIVGFINYINGIISNKIILIYSHEVDYIVVDNYIEIDRHTTRVSMEEFSYVMQLLKKYLGLDLEIKPFRKVYLSRKKVSVRTIQKNDERSSLPFFDDQRLLDEEVIEEFFLANGFEIVCPEDFESFESQAKYFNEVKVLVSLSSSGIGNSMFMQTNTDILELVTSFFVESFVQNGGDYTSWPVLEVLHGQYGPLAYTLNQNYARVPNYDRSPVSLINRITSSKSISSFLGIGDNE